MEFALPYLLSREDILKILDRRHLNIRSMNELTHDELMRIYKTFVMPLSRRPERRKKIKENYEEMHEYDDHDDVHVQSLDYSDKCMDIDIVPTERYECNDGHTSGYRVTSPVVEKRHRSDDEDDLDSYETDYQHQLSSVTKRIRINSLS